MENTSKTRRTSKKATHTNKEVEVQDVSGDKELSLNELIKVMSLLDYPLNLSTQAKGQGKSVKFDSFGQVKRIMYGTLIEMMETHRNFLERGYFIILDKRVINAHGLQETYESILTKESIESVLSGSKEGLALYKSCNPEQQSTIIEMMIDRVKNDPDSVDLNMVDKLSRESGININKKADDLRENLKNYKKPNGEE